jgi:Ca2+-binding RTX toxin-like protein
MRRTTFAHLSVNPLEGREVPACVVTHPTPDTVVITGNGANDVVIVRDNGMGTVSGTATGAGAFSFTGIKDIRVLTGDGSDRVSYTLVRSLQPGQTRDVAVSLGSSPRGGQDQFVANLYNPATGVGSDLLVGSHLGITVFGGDGRDVIFVNAFKDTDVATGAELDLALWGQAGNDVIMTHYRGENDGTVKLVSDGGVGTT